MYKNNSRDIGKLKGYSSPQLSCNLKGNSHAIRYYSYTSPLHAINKRKMK